MNDTPKRRLWVGIDAGKAHHWACAVDEDGKTRFSAKVTNDEAQILDAVEQILALGAPVCWGVDISSAPSALLLALLAASGQDLVYVPGKTAGRMSGAYRGEAKTDARDAYVIAETVRHRGDFAPIEVPAQVTADLALLTAHRGDLIADRVRMVNRLRDVLTGIFPALERAFDYSNSKSALTLLTGYQTPERIRRAGAARLAQWLHKRGVRIDRAELVAGTAVEAARAQLTELPGQATAARIVAELAQSLLDLDERIVRCDRDIRTTFSAHPQAVIIESLPGMGPILGAEFLVAAGDLAAYADAGHLASAAGLVPVPRDSGRRTGNFHRPKRYSRELRRVFYMSAQVSITRPGPNRDYYTKKRAEGCRHTQAVIALARRRTNVLWALLRDGRLFQETAPART
ncbi:IS110 family transposase [Glycomyces tenuis]|uniref:IS110 family transposase n=1 Tax=Glycomyces tenuis TaxID=58116 RepID=UPI000422E3EB|nr:IS110 family transposase [Glycomyces tenuis]